MVTIIVGNDDDNNNNGAVVVGRPTKARKRSGSYVYCYQESICLLRGFAGWCFLFFCVCVYVFFVFQIHYHHYKI